MELIRCDGVCKKCKCKVSPSLISSKLHVPKSLDQTLSTEVISCSSVVLFFMLASCKISSC